MLLERTVAEVQWQPQEVLAQPVLQGLWKGRDFAKALLGSERSMESRCSMRPQPWWCNTSVRCDLSLPAGEMLTLSFRWLIAERWKLQTGRDQGPELSCGRPATPSAVFRRIKGFVLKPTSWLHGIIHRMFWLGSTLKIPTLQPWAEPPSIRTVTPHAIWPGTIPGVEILARYFYGVCPTAFIEGLDWDFTALIFGKGFLISRLNLFVDKLYLLHLCLVCSLALHTSELIDVICFCLSVHLLMEIIHAEEDSHAQREVILTSLKGLNNYSWSECDQALGLLTNSIIYS